MKHKRFLNKPVSKLFHLFYFIFSIEKQKEESEREDCTILVNRLHLRCDEQEIYKFFKTQECGKVRDIKIIKDSRSGKSKG